MEKMNRIERAKQFAPYSALRGFDLMVKEITRIKCDKIALDDADIEKINQVLSSISKGDLVKIKYYETDSYKTAEGLVSEINETAQFIKVVKTKIFFSDIYTIEKCD